MVLSLDNPTARLNYPWVESSPAKFVQNYDSIQQWWMDWINGERDANRTSFLLATCVKIRSSLNPDNLEAQLRQAWIAMRYFNPGLAIRLYPTQKLYVTATPDVLEAWLQSSFQVHRDGVTPEDIHRSLHQATYPTLHFFPSKGGGCEMLFTSHHFFGDGRGLFYMWDALLKLLVEPVKVYFGDEWKNLPRVRDDILALPVYPSANGLLRGAEMLRNVLVTDMLQLPVTYSHEQEQVGRNGRIRVSLSAEETSAVISACKMRGISVTSAVKAGMMLALQEAGSIINGNAPQDHGHFIGIVPFDARPWYPSSFDPIQNLGNSHLAIIPAAFDIGGKSFDTLAAEANHFFKSTRSEFSRSAEGIDGAMYGVRTIFAPSAPMASSPFFSSFGKVEQFMSRTYGTNGEIEVDDVWAATTSLKTVVNAWFLSTFNGILRLDVTYNDAYFDPDSLRKHVLESFRLMLTGLGNQ